MSVCDVSYYYKDISYPARENQLSPLLSKVSGGLQIFSHEEKQQRKTVAKEQDGHFRK